MAKAKPSKVSASAASAPTLGQICVDGNRRRRSHQPRESALLYRCRPSSQYRSDLGGGTAKKPPSFDSNPTAKRETLDPVRAYYKIEDANVRTRLRELTMAIGAGASSSEQRSEDLSQIRLLI